MLSAILSKYILCVATSPTLAQDNITSAGTTVKVPKGSSYFHTNPLLKFNCLWHPAFETSVISHHPLMASHHTWNKVQTSPYNSCMILALPLKPYCYSLCSFCCRHLALSFCFSKHGKQVSFSGPLLLPQPGGLYYQEFSWLLPLPS